MPRLRVPLARLNVATVWASRARPLAYSIEAAKARLPHATLAIVAAREKKKATSAESWLIEGAELARPEKAKEASHPEEPERAASDDDPWLQVPEPANGAGVSEAPRARPHTSRELVDAVEERDALRNRVEALESELADLKRRPAWDGTGSRPDDKPKAEPKPKSPARPAVTKKSATGAKLDLNAATFEELRDLGLSVTLSARLIAYRDVRDGYESLDELNGIPGLSKETLGEIREQLKVEA